MDLHVARRFMAQARISHKTRTKAMRAAGWPGHAGHAGRLDVDAHRSGAEADAVLEIVEGEVRTLAERPLERAQDQFFAQLLLIDQGYDRFNEGKFFRSTAFESSLETIGESDFFLLSASLAQTNGSQHESAERNEPMAAVHTQVPLRAKRLS